MKQKASQKDKQRLEELAKLSSSPESVIILRGTAPRKAGPKPEAWAKSRKPPGGKLPDWE